MIDELLELDDLAIAVGRDNWRVMAEVFEHPKGIVFADIGWPTASWHPFHIIKGTLTRTERPGPGWTIGDSWVHRVADTLEPSISYEHRQWRRWRESAEGRKFDREACLREIQKDGMFEWVD